MCGITGIIGYGFEHRHLDMMMHRIAHRGPDGQGKWTNGAVSFGHLRLKIIDLSERAAQPMICSVTGNILTFNGEIYNYKELSAELKGDYPFRSDSDTEVILAAYQKWGIQCLKKLRGMFAFALYDATQKKVLLARDRFGIKPLYFRRENRCFLFSSEIKGVVNLPGLSQTPNHRKIFGFLAHRHLDTDEETFFNEVRQLLPATSAWVDENGIMSEPVSYWNVPRPGDRVFQEKDREIFRENLRESIRLHLRADVPLACFLSGGLDSSSIACLASGLLEEGQSLNTYSSILKEKNEENALIDLVRDYLPKAVHNGVVFDGGNFLQELPTITRHHDEPFADASMYVHWELCKLAQQHGIKVMLSGNGGDEILGGYSSHLYSELGRLLHRFQLVDYVRYTMNYPVHRPESVLQFFVRSIQEILPFQWRELQKRQQSIPAKRLLTGNFDPSNYIFYRFRNKDPYEANMLNNLCSWTVPQFLHYEDRNSMAFGIEIRVPMLDHDFMEYVMQYRPEDLLKYRTKQLLRDSLSGFVPEPVLKQRLKHGFAAPLENFVNFDTKGTLRFYKEQVQTIPFFNRPEVERLGTEVLEKGEYGRFHYFWRVLSLAIWYNTFFNG